MTVRKKETATESRQRALAEGRLIRKSLPYVVEFYSRPTPKGRERTFKYTHRISQHATAEEEREMCENILIELRAEKKIGDNWRAHICRSNGETAQIAITGLFPAEAGSPAKAPASQLLPITEKLLLKAIKHVLTLRELLKESHVPKSVAKAKDKALKDTEYYSELLKELTR